METIKFEVDGHVGILTLNRPEMVNAVNRKMTDEMIDFWQKRHEDFDAGLLSCAVPVSGDFAQDWI